MKRMTSRGSIPRGEGEVNSLLRSIDRRQKKTRRFGRIRFTAREMIGLGTRVYRATRRGRTLSGTGEASSASACTGWSPLLSSLTSIPAAFFFFPRPVAGFAASGSIKAGASAFFSARPAFAAPEAGRGSASAFAPSSGLVAGESFFSPASFSGASAPDFRAGRFGGITPRNAVLPRFHARKDGCRAPDAGRTLQSRRNWGCARGSNGSLDTLIDKRAFRLTGRRASVCGVGSARRAACNQSSGGFAFPAIFRAVVDVRNNGTFPSRSSTQRRARRAPCHADRDPRAVASLGVRIERPTASSFSSARPFDGRGR